MLHVMVLTGFETVTHFVKKNPKPGYFYSMLMSLLLFQPWLIVHVVCLYIQVIILCCSGSISAVSWLNIHELWIFCDLVLQHVTCHGLMGFETITHFVKNPKPGYFYSMLEFTVDLTLYSRFYYIAEDQSQSCWSKI
jgi:hypothetical protein